MHLPKHLLASMLIVFLSAHDSANAQTSAASSAAIGLIAQDLRCEYLSSPVSINTYRPRLSWKLTGSSSKARGLRQSAYQILVASSQALLAKDVGDMWDSGRVESDHSVNVEYKGNPLKSDATYYWKMRVWNGDDQPTGWSEASRWEMGLLKANDWQARWITPQAPKASDREDIGALDESYSQRDFTLPPCRKPQLPAPMS